jgi:hypothetical protein
MMRFLARLNGFNAGFAAITIAFALFAPFVRGYTINPDADAAPHKLALGTAATPYQYRVLVPAIARRTATTLTPEDLRRRYLQIDCAFLIVLGFAFRSYLKRFVASPLADVLAPAIFVLLSFNYATQSFYPYDVPAVVFTTLGLVLIGAGRFGWLYPLFVLATFNRETSLFLVLAMVAIWWDRQPLWKTAAHAIGLLAAWLAIKGYLFELYRANPQTGAGLFQSQWKMNAALLLGDPFFALTALSAWGFLWVPTVLRFNRITAPELRRAVMLVPVFVAGMMFVGVMNETRIYGEMLPIITAAACVVFVDFLKSDVR